MHVHKTHFPADLSDRGLMLTSIHRNFDRLAFLITSATLRMSLVINMGYIPHMAWPQENGLELVLIDNDLNKLSNNVSM